MKKFTFTLLACLMVFAATAQIGYNYSQYDIGFSGALNTVHSDFSRPKKGYAAQAQFTYNYTPFINYIAEVQAGTLAADSLSAIPGTALTFTNDYVTVAFRAQLQMGEIMDYSRNQFSNFLKNIYISAGVGVIYTDLKVFDTGALSAESKGSNLYIPLKAGYEFKLLNDYSEPWAKIDFGYQYNYIFSDNLDGITYGKTKDAFSQIVVGFKFAIGGVTSYRKSIAY